MPKRLRPIGYEDRLSVVDHLDELRGRLMVCGAVLVVAFGLAFWQNSLLLKVLNDPLHHVSNAASNHLNGVTGDQASERKHLTNAAGLIKLYSTQPDVSLKDSAILSAIGDQINSAAKSLPKSSPGAVPLTIGVGEPFTVTITVCLYFALLISLPVLLYQAYAFIIPAMNPREKRAALPVMVMAPILFVIGVVFTYIVVLPAAIKFLQGYNATQFQALVQAKPLYSFEVMVMGAIGLAFEMPLVLLGLRQAGVIDGNTLTKHWRYAVVVLAVLGAALPGADPVTTGLEVAPLLLLFLVSIVLLKYADRREAKRAARELATHDVGGFGADQA